MQQTVTIPAVRPTVGTQSTAFGVFNVIAASGTVNSSWVAQPYRLADVVDVSRPILVTLPILNTGENLTPNLVVRLQLSASAAHAPPGVALSLPSVSINWPVPNPWQAGQRGDVAFESAPGSRETWPGWFFTPDSLLGLGWSRIGVHPNDTYGTINLPGALLLKFYPRCQLQCCVV